ncbi:hypothetical protein [Streptomyces venezuelae]|uniref:hypothetical protein n=1 Tax=Streptomyces venezuelae TaxID=54571 RepID=UPI00342E0795
MSRELLLICQGCGNRITDDAGYLWVHTQEVHTAQQEARAWEAQHPANGESSLDLLDLLDHPEPIRWRSHHQACDPDRDSSHYRIPAARLHTRADLLDWTAHLMEKGWLPHTDWRDVLSENRHGGTRFASLPRQGR